MIQFNLLPDVKLEYIKAENQRRLLMTISVVVAIASVAIFILSFAANQLQSKHSRDLSADIASASAKLQNQKQLDKVLTVQNQLQSLTGLHDAKPATSRIFDYLNQLTPAQVNITTVHVDFNEHTVTISGEADALSTVNKFVDTLKFTMYTTDSDVKDAESSKAFTSVVLSTFSLSAGEGSKASFGLTMAYDPVIFETTKKVSLTVPNLITTRSELEKPTELFTAPVTSTKPAGGK